MGHVLSGWDGYNPLVNPSNLCAYPDIFVVYHKQGLTSFQSIRCVC
jgi:hypothetical protein